MCQKEGLVEPYAEVIRCIHAWQPMSLWRVDKSHTVMGCVQPAERGMLGTAGGPVRRIAQRCEVNRNLAGSW